MPRRVTIPWQLSAGHTAVAAVFMFLTALPALAQFQLLLRPADIRAWPEVRIPLRVVNNSADIRTMTAANFEVKENGVPQSPLTLSCHNDSLANVVHFMFIMDVSLSMGFIEGTRVYDTDSVKWRRAKQVFTEAFRRLRPIDYGAFISFAFEARLHQNFTRDIRLLENEVAGLFLRSGTAIYDAALQGLAYCNADTGKTVIILLTDGSDQSSMFTIEDVIAGARANSIPIYMIGLGVDTADVAGMREISRRTGGEFFLAPTSEELSAVFERIMRSVIMSECVLSYVSSDTCSNGGKRDVAVTINLDGNTETGFVDYTLPDYRSRIRLVAAPPDTIPDDAPVSVPVRVEGEIRPGEGLTATLDLSFDAGLLVFSRIETAGCVLDGAVVSAQLIAPGLLRISTTNAMPQRGVLPSKFDTLFTIVFDVPHRNANAHGAMNITALTLRQQCETISRGDGETFMVNGCPEMLRLHMSDAVLPSRATGAAVPIFLDDTIDIHQNLAFSFVLRYDTAILRFSGISGRACIAEGGTLQTTLLEPGRVLVNCPAFMPRFATGPLLHLLFDIRYQSAASRVMCMVENLNLKQTCEPRTAFTGAYLILDGYCDPAFVTKDALQLLAISPNPLSAVGEGVARIQYAVRGQDRARLEVTTLEGEVVLVLVDAYLPKGQHSVSLPVQGLASGSYLCTLREGFSLATKLLLVTR